MYWTKEREAVPPTEDHDAQVRNAAFEFLRNLRAAKSGEPFARTELERGFEFAGSRVPLVGPPGIFKPQLLPEIPLSITTKPTVPGQARPYDDQIGSDGIIRYRYRGTDPTHRDNVGLRKAMRDQVPLVYFYGIVPGSYEAAWPAYIVGDHPGTLTVDVMVDDARSLSIPESHVQESDVAARREYVTRVTQQRLHQRDFRERVLSAYRNQCALCQLRHRELLDAAHIVPDSDPRGEPHITNGLSLCKIHHAAFDNNFVGIRPDLVVEVRPAIMKEEDGPMLQHGLKELHGRPMLVIPKRTDFKPNAQFLEERFAEFKRLA
jgi:putative restriction endonuclease